MKAQALRVGSAFGAMAGKKHLELNPDHSIVNALNDKAKDNPNDAAVKNLVQLLMDTSLLESGFTLENPKEHAERIHRMIKSGINIDDDDDDDDDDVDEGGMDVDGDG